MEAIGPPITIGAVDLSDRRRNYIGELESKVWTQKGGWTEISKKLKYKKID